jgi:flavin reductase (DIM6/NTAB) family NADH-FMN oxidoreductase RutF
VGVDPQTFKETLAHWATGVTVVTAQAADGRPVGITVSSLTSLSIEPPQVLISVNKRLYTHDAIRQGGVFAANILRAEQVEWGMRFAGLVPELEDRFAGIEPLTAVTGCRILPGVLAWIDCEVRHAYDGDDHTIFVGEVVAAGGSGGGAPLLYYNRQWRVLAGEPLPAPR